MAYQKRPEEQTGTVPGCEKRTMTGRVLIPGSFDPVTYGHLDIIRRASGRFGRVFVAVMTNDMQKYDPHALVKHYLFRSDERVTMMKLACEGLPNVEVLEAEGRLIDWVDRLDVDWIIKGVRTETDFVYEQKHALWNRAHNPHAETLYLPADPALDGISSTLVRRCLQNGDPTGDFLPPAVAEWIAARMRRMSQETKQPSPEYGETL